MCQASWIGWRAPYYSMSWRRSIAQRFSSTGTDLRAGRCCRRRGQEMRGICEWPSSVTRGVVDPRGCNQSSTKLAQPGDWVPPLSTCRRPCGRPARSRTRVQTESSPTSRSSLLDLTLDVKVVAQRSCVTKRKVLALKHSCLILGPVVHRLTFGEAIDQDLLSDYQVVRWRH